VPAGGLASKKETGINETTETKQGATTQKRLLLIFRDNGAERPVRKKGGLTPQEVAFHKDEPSKVLLFQNVSDLAWGCTF
jgi:hypothetical protein